MIPGGASAAATTCPPHAPSMCPPTTAASWMSRPGRVAASRRSARGRPSRTGSSPLERVGDRDQDPLAVDQQVGQVVGDEVAERDRQQPGADRAETRPSGRPRTRAGRRCPRKREQQERPLEDAGRAEQVEEGLRLRQAVEEDRRDAEGDERHVGRRPARLEQPAPERPSPDAPVLVDQRDSARAGRAGGTRP